MVCVLWPASICRQCATVAIWALQDLSSFRYSNWIQHAFMLFPSFFVSPSLASLRVFVVIFSVWVCHGLTYDTIQNLGLYKVGTKVWICLSKKQFGVNISLIDSKNSCLEYFIIYKSWSQKSVCVIAGTFPTNGTVSFEMTWCHQCEGRDGCFSVWRSVWRPIQGRPSDEHMNEICWNMLK